MNYMTLDHAILLCDKIDINFELDEEHLYFIEKFFSRVKNIKKLNSSLSETVINKVYISDEELSYISKYI